MSGSIIGGGHHDEHGDKGRTTLGWWVLGIFVAVWLINSWIFYSTSKRYEEWLESAKKTAETHADPHSSSPNGHAPPHDWRASLYRSLQLFHFHDTHWPDNWPDNYIHLKSDRGWVYFARFSGAFVGLSIPLVVLAFFFQGGVRRFRHRVWPGHAFVVVVGDSKAAGLLVEDLKERARPFVRISTGLQHSHAVAGPHFFLPKDESLHERTKFWNGDVRVSNAHAVVLFEEDDAENIRLSLEIDRALGHSNSNRRSPLRCHIHLRDLHLQKGLASLVLGDARHSATTRSYFNRFELMARLLMRHYPLPPSLVPPSTPTEHYVIVGFGPFGQNVALKLVKMGQQLVEAHHPSTVKYTNRPPHITIVDPHGEDAAAAFFHSYPGFKTPCDLQFFPHACTSDAFLRLQFLPPKWAGDRCSIFFCLEDESLATATILRLLDVLPKNRSQIHRFYFHSPRHGTVGQLLLENSRAKADGPSVVGVAADDDVFTEETILNLSLDALASQLHADWRAARSSSSTKNARRDRPWEDLDEDIRDENREPAEYALAKLRQLGFEFMTRAEAQESPGQPIASPQEVMNAINADDFARSEHNRWTISRLLSGWKHGLVRKDEEKLHDCLLPFERLPDNIRNMDSAVVRVIAALLTKGEFCARVIPPAK